ncbi:Envoplakin [Bagarius yarrelli]|uniref:Envoplakin n=1 Tax=Bagarius yarrelli TaxID=175774 RepID=A0A556V7A1_BAGYA|nr:Envoplakin [Bagarius yarrelli]
MPRHVSSHLISFLTQDAENGIHGTSLTQRIETADNLAEAETLLKQLFMDVDKVKKLMHPQAAEIEQDVSHLHDRWSENCRRYRDLYQQGLELDLSPQVNWTELLSSKLSARRKKHLSSLYDYILRCDKEVSYLTEQQDRIRKTDWSDLIRDVTGLRSDSDKLKSNGILSHENEVIQLQNEGAELLNESHPGSQAIMKHKAEVQREWQRFLNLCSCQATHLDNVDIYRKFQLDSETISESIKRINSTMEPSLLSKMSNSQILMQLEASINRKDKCTLLSSPRDETWEVKNSLGEKKNIPGVCFVIPPPDKEAMERVESLEQEFSGLKRRRASLLASVKTQNVQVANITQTAVSASNTYKDHRSSLLSNRLDQLNTDLLQLEKEVLGRLRAPLNQADHTRDLVARIQDHKSAIETLRNLEAEKTSIQRELEPLLSAKPLEPVTSSYPSKLSSAKNKTEDLNLLIDLYGKKANAVLSLENQMNNVDTALKQLEDSLARDTIILDKPEVIQVQNKKLQDIKNDFAAHKGDIQELNKDLELTEQLCGHLQKNFQEYCPDIYRQETEVRNLRNRYTNINNQLQQRLALMQELTNKYQVYKSAVRSLSVSLNDLPSNKILSGDSLTEIQSKLKPQKWAVDELRRKSDNLNQISSLSRELQTILKEYEDVTYKYRSTIAHSSEPAWEITQENHAPTFAEGIQNMEKNTIKRYHELLAENVQVLNRMELTSNLINKNDVVTKKVVMHQQREKQENESLKKDLADEITRRIHVENEIDTYRTRLLSLKNRRGVERVEEKETVHYYRSPNLEADLETMKKKVQEEAAKHSVIQREIEIVSKKLMAVDLESIKIKPKLLTKVTTQICRDPLLEKEAEFIRQEMKKIREEIRIRETEILQWTTEIDILERKAPVIKEKVIKKEVVKVEKDPEMFKAVIILKEELSDMDLRCKSFSEETVHLRSQINKLEMLIPTIQPQIVIKEVLKIEKDKDLIKESKFIRLSLDELRNEISILLNEISTLKVHYSQVDQVKQRVEVKEIINEVFKISPETEADIKRLKKEIQEWMSKRTEIGKTISSVMVDIKSYHSQKPIVEVKEVKNEIIKEERSPEMVQEITRLKEKLAHLQTTYQTLLETVTSLRKERDVLKVERSKVEVQVVTKETVRYENDPLLEKEADRLRKEIQEHHQLYRTVEETIYDLRQKYIVMEKQKAEEKIIYEEIVVLQKDQNQILEHELLKRKLEMESRSRLEMEAEVKKLKDKVSELVKSVNQTDIRKKKILVETELRQIKSQILEFGNAPPPEEKVIIEELIKIERDPKMDTLIRNLRNEIEEENAKVIAMERDIQNLRVKIGILTKEKSEEKIVYKEEEEIQRVNHKITRIQTSVTSFSKEEFTLNSNRDALLKEKEELLRELKRLENERHEITVSFQHETKLLSEKTQVRKQKVFRLEAEIKSLEKDILAEKEKIEQRETTIIKLQETLQNEDHSERHMRETTKSTRITILDPETGKDMSPYDAYVQGLIDRNHYIHLQTLECSWEEITNTGPDGETTILRDCKSGKSYSIQDALTEGRLTQYDFQQYQQGKIPISEFALKVAGEKVINPPTLPEKRMSTSSSLNNYNFSSSRRKSSLSTSLGNLSTIGNADETFPISGVLDTTTKSRMSVRSAMTRKLIDPDTAVKLLEAQAATGGIVDINKKERYSVHKATERGIIELSQMDKLIAAQKAFTGFEDPATKLRLSVGVAAQKKWISAENARRCLEAQLLTGGLVDPNKAGRISLNNAIAANLIDEKLAKEIKDDDKMLRDLINPITKSAMTYKEAMALCQKDSTTGLLLLPAASTDSTDFSLYSSYQVFTY